MAVKKVRHSKFYKTILFTVLFAAICSHYAYSSLSSNVIIQSTGYVVNGTDVAAASGSSRDIQAAVDWIVAHGGVGNVYIPAGTFNFVEVGEPWVTVNVPAGVNIFGAPTERDANGQVVEWKTILVMPYDVPGDVNYSPIWFSLTGNNNGKTSRFSDIMLQGYRYEHPSSITVHRCLTISGMVNWRVDHCYFRDTTGGMWIGADHNPNYRGVIDHCKFVNTNGVPEPYESLTVGYGVGLGDTFFNTWNPIEDVLGHYTDQTVVIEDCYFEKWRHCVTGDYGSHYIFRHNIVKNDFGFGSLDEHENRTYVSARACEVYDNQFLDPLTGWSETVINFRGGGGVVFNNVVRGYSKLAFLAEFSQEDICQPHDIWVWNNYLPSNCADVVVDGNFRDGADYWRHAPTTFSYVPYIYPHPLALEP